MTAADAEVTGVRNSGGPGLGSSGVSDPAHVPSERRRGTGLAVTGPPAPSTAGPGWTPSGPSSVSGRRGRAVDPNRRSLGTRYECRGTVLSSYRHVRRCRTAPTPVLEHRRRGGRTVVAPRPPPPAAGRPAGPPARRGAPSRQSAPTSSPGASGGESTASPSPHGLPRGSSVRGPVVSRRYRVDSAGPRSALQNYGCTCGSTITDRTRDNDGRRAWN